MRFAVLFVLISLFFVILSQQFFFHPGKTSAQITLGTYTAVNGVIYKNNAPIQLHGVSWFGFETPNYVFHGLWTRNWRDMITQMKSIGINAIRIPFCPVILNSGTIPNSIDYSKNPDLQGLNSLQVLDKVMNELNNQQMYILLDMHRPDCNAISELWYTSTYSETQWITDWKTIATRYANLEYFMGADLKNEPHGAARWGNNNTATDWRLAADKAGNAVLSSNPNLLIFVEGVESNNGQCTSADAHWWGGNIEPVDCSPLTQVPANKVVLAPHVYGPDVYNQTYFTASNFPQDMPGIWDQQFGRFANQYAIAIGEWGGKYGTGGGLASDKTLQDALVSYNISHHICNSFYWAWNPNSGDTGGLLQDDWTTLWSSKVALVQNYFNSCSYGTTVTNTTPTPTKSVTPTPSTSCALQQQGDVNCDGTIDLVDFEIWRRSYIGN